MTKGKSETARVHAAALFHLTYSFRKRMMMVRVSRSLRTVHWFVLLLVVVTGTSYSHQGGDSQQASSPGASNAASQAQSGGGHSQSPGSISQQDVIAFLNQTITWQRHFAVEQQIATEPADVIFLNDNRALLNQVVKLSFDFARAEAELMAAQN